MAMGWVCTYAYIHRRFTGEGIGVIALRPRQATRSSNTRSPLQANLASIGHVDVLSSYLNMAGSGALKRCIISSPQQLQYDRTSGCRVNLRYVQMFAHLQDWTPRLSCRTGRRDPDQ